MVYQAITFTAGRLGAGYLEIDDSVSAVVRLTDNLGSTIVPAAYEYYITSTTPSWLSWMKSGLVT